MDLDEWEFLSDDGFLDFNEDREKRIFLGKRNPDSKRSLDSEYILCPSPDSRKITEPSQVVPAPIPLDPKIVTALDDELVKEISRKPEEVEADQDTALQGSFGTKGNEFVDTTMDSPKSICRGISPPIEEKVEAMDTVTSPRLKTEKETLSSIKDDDINNNNNGGFNLWKWSFTGIGAICTFGVAAATICVLYFGTQPKNKLHQDQKIRFKIYTDDKRIKQVVEHATKLNEAISAVRGGSLSRAHITYGGYHDGLLTIE